MRNAATEESATAELFPKHPDDRDEFVTANGKRWRVVEQHPASLRERWQMARTLTRASLAVKPRSWRLLRMSLRYCLRPSAVAAYWAAAGSASATPKEK